MAVNKLRIRLNQRQDGDLNRRIVIPLKHTTDEFGRGDLIKEYEDGVIDTLLDLKRDYEVTQYSHDYFPGDNKNPVDPSPNTFYDFNFGNLINTNPLTLTYPLTPLASGGFNSDGVVPCLGPRLEALYPTNAEATIYSPYDPSNITTWYGYDNQGFTPEQTYRNEKSFVKSFFKLDLYDSPLRNEQKLLISLILSPLKGEKIFRPTLDLSCPSDGKPDGRYNCKPEGEKYVVKPSFTLSPIDNSEGYYIYWLKEESFIKTTVFYMSAKFYNGKSGEVTQFLNKPQNTLSNPFVFKPEENFYYRVNLNRDRFTYSVFNTQTNSRVGTTADNRIKFYQYFNSP
tara:strand:+ start:8117 stop:9139 length:1023 start_codon:yes stop_codon:yes gene_type:complete